MARAQVSFEFMMTLVFVVIITTVFGVVAADRISEIKDQQKTQELQNVAIVAKNEIDIAHSMESGYERRFDLPYFLGNDNYSIDIENNFITVSSQNKVFAVTIQAVSGELNYGSNIIRKTESGVMVNG